MADYPEKHFGGDEREIEVQPEKEPVPGMIPPPIPDALAADFNKLTKLERARADALYATLGRREKAVQLLADQLQATAYQTKELVAEVERLRKQQMTTLVAFYNVDAVACANLCDNVLDPKGALLGHVRDAVLAARVNAKAAETWRTPSGRVLNDHDIEKLAREAEQGYDVQHLLRDKESDNG